MWAKAFKDLMPSGDHFNTPDDAFVYPETTSNNQFVVTLLKWLQPCFEEKSDTDSANNHKV